MNRILIPAREVRTEIMVSNSRFITSISPAFSVEEARSFINRIRGEFKNASHNVPAFIIGHGKSIIEHCHDDGEPSGTAGHPMLAVLRGSEIGDIVGVVTRYFGGTKLGKGGLVRAYGNAVHSALDILPLAEKTSTHVVMVVVSYPLFERTQILVENHKGVILERTFEADVTIAAQFRTEDFDPFQIALSDLSSGTIKAEIIETNNETIIPLY